MKWINIVILSLLVVFGFPHMAYATVKAPLDSLFSPSLSSNTTIALTVSAAGVATPLKLTLIYIDDYTVKIDWQKSPSANNTMIRASYNAYPNSVTDGYLVYYGMGDTANDTAVNWYENAGTIYVSAWSDNYTGVPGASWAYSTSYITSSLENPAMVDIAAQLTIFNNIMKLLLDVIPDIFTIAIAFIPLIMLSIFALWKENAILFMVVFGVAMLTGLYTPDIMAENGATTNLGISIGLCLIAYGLLSASWAFRLMLWEKE